MSATRSRANEILPLRNKAIRQFCMAEVDVQHSLRELRPISTPRLRPSPDFHLVPINLIISQGT
jgi:hypothetical protein